MSSASKGEVKKKTAEAEERLKEQFAPVALRRATPPCYLLLEESGSCQHEDLFTTMAELCGTYKSDRALLNRESKVGKWTMRICNFMVDHLGEWDLIWYNSDNLQRSCEHGPPSFHHRTSRQVV